MSARGSASMNHCFPDALQRPERAWSLLEQMLAHYKGPCMAYLYGGVRHKLVLFDDLQASFETLIDVQPMLRMALPGKAWLFQWVPVEIPKSEQVFMPQKFWKKWQGSPQNTPWPIEKFAFSSKHLDPTVLEASEVLRLDEALIPFFRLYSRQWHVESQLEFCIGGGHEEDLGRPMGVFALSQGLRKFWHVQTTAKLKLKLLHQPSGLSMIRMLMSSDWGHMDARVLVEDIEAWSTGTELNWKPLDMNPWLHLWKKDYPWILSHEALEVLIRAWVKDFNAQSLFKNDEHPLSRHAQGSLLCSESLSLKDEVSHIAFKGRPFDDDGVQTSSIVLIDKGRYRQVVSSWTSGYWLNGSGTGHGYWTRHGLREEARHLILDLGSQGTDLSLIRRAHKTPYIHRIEKLERISLRHWRYRAKAPQVLWIESGEIVGQLGDLWLVFDLWELLVAILSVGSYRRVHNIYLPSIKVADGIRWIHYR